jgi:hypothetical protein
VEHTRIARELARERRRLIEGLPTQGLSQSDIARELGVTRQAIQKMVEVGAERPRRRNARECSTTSAGCSGSTGAPSSIPRWYVRPRIKGHHVRDEAFQARRIVEDLTILDAAGVDRAFVAPSPNRCHPMIQTHGTTSTWAC